MVSFCFKSSVLDETPYITLVLILPVIKLKALQNSVSGSAVYMSQVRMIDIVFPRNISSHPLYLTPYDISNKSCAANADGSAWSTAKFHWHGGWGSMRKSCTHGYITWKRGGGMLELAVVL